MENLIYLTAIRNVKTNELIHVFVNPNTKEKLISMDNDKYTPIDNPYIKSLLNCNIETQRNNGFMKTALILGSSIILTSFIISSPTTLDIFDTGISIVKNKTHLSYSTYEYNNINSFIKRLESTINSNDSFNSEEKYVITNGLTDFFKDWGYLYSDSELNGILYRLQKVKIHRGGTISRNAAGEYIFLNINLDKDSNELTTSHEVFHCIFDINKPDILEELFGFGSAYREAIVESLNKMYAGPYSKAGSFTYTEQRKDLVKLSLLIDKKQIMEKFLLENVSIVDLISNSCRDVSKKDIIKYIALLDAKKQLYNSRQGYELVESTKDEENDLYNMMYKSKYNKDFDIDFLLSEDFLDNNIEFSKDGYRYSLSKRMFNKVDINNYSDLDNHFVGLDHNSNSEQLLFFLSDFDTRNRYKDDINGYFDYLYNKYKDDKSKLISFLNLLHVEYNSFNDFFDLYIDSLNERNLEPYLFALELKEGLKTFNDLLYVDNDNKDYDLRELMKGILEIKLKKEQSKEVLYWFCNTDLEFESYDIFYKDDCVVNNRYNVVQTIPFKLVNNEIITYMDNGFKYIYLNETKQDITKINDVNGIYSNLFNRNDVVFYKLNVFPNENGYLILFEEKYEYTSTDMLCPYSKHKIKALIMD